MFSPSLLFYLSLNQISMLTTSANICSVKAVSPWPNVKKFEWREYNGEGSEYNMKAPQTVINLDFNGLLSTNDITYCLIARWFLFITCYNSAAQK